MLHCMQLREKPRMVGAKEKKNREKVLVWKFIRDQLAAERGGQSLDREKNKAKSFTSSIWNSLLLALASDFIREQRQSRKPNRAPVIECLIGTDTDGIAHTTQRAFTCGCCQYFTVCVKIHALGLQRFFNHQPESLPCAQSTIVYSTAPRCGPRSYFRLQPKGNLQVTSFECGL